jgi:hypothetical protein
MVYLSERSPRKTQKDTKKTEQMIPGVSFLCLLVFFVANLGRRMVASAG